MKLTEIVPWGRTLAEYKLMFDLSDADLNRQILGCGDGPASFNAEMTERGKSVTSIDPIYQFTAAQIEQRVRDTYSTIISQVSENSSRYTWNYFANPEELGCARMDAMNEFLANYETGKSAGRYLCQSLPKLDFSDRKFDLCVCSHLLFLYSEQLSLDFHIESICELLRVAAEVRIFPLLKLDCNPSAYIDPVIEKFTQAGFDARVRAVNYEFQKGGDSMLVIKK
ncbi:SAM-dependent methyltransferase [Chamaesiphon sp. VAR_48_metabat_403]|uniref:SAM-dependent methyltransferase n=1 Tax=Chamaesiphon sp. VAR_48_metabat_403 TaxID=2964700 RepID=UPI00286E0887|nr:SAM-dependent methyltransferase [Chamaesiphon sp. VAR_48_metabat_403]